MIQVTEKAYAHMMSLIESRAKKPLGVRLSVKTRGCSGLAYKIEFVDEILNTDEKIVLNDLLLLIDSKSILVIFGSVVDFVDEKTQSGFVFQNPNQKGQCGCGESFYV